MANVSFTNRTAATCCIALCIATALCCAGRQGGDRHRSLPAQGAPSSAASDTEAKPSVSLGGPPCGLDGPSIQMTGAPTFHGKPPLRLAMMDARIHNPLSTSVWLLYDLGGSTLPSVVEDVSLSKSAVAPLAYVWTFSGDRSFRALRIPPGADLSVRRLELSSWSYDEPLLVAFASAVQVADRPSETWIRQAGMLEPHGSFDLDGLADHAERHWDNFRGARLAVSVLCATRADADAPLSLNPSPLDRDASQILRTRAKGLVSLRSDVRTMDQTRRTKFHRRKQSFPREEHGLVLATSVGLPRRRSVPRSLPRPAIEDSSFVVR